MAPSTFWISMSVFLISWYWALLFALDPLRQMSADLNKVNEILLLFHDIVLTYCLPFFMEISSASRPWYLRHSLPIRPAVVITQGVNVLCSMSRTLLECQYRRFFPFSCIQQICCGSRSLYDSACGWQTLTSKNVYRWCSQNPRAWISNLTACAYIRSST